MTVLHLELWSEGLDVRPLPQAPSEQVKLDEAQTDKNTYEKKQHILYLKVDNLQSEKYLKVKNVLEIFAGNTQVVFKVTDTNQKLRAPRSLWVMLNEPMVNELKYILGDDSVFIS